MLFPQIHPSSTCFRTMGIYVSKTLMQALFSCLVNLKNEHNVSSILKHDTNAQKFPMAPHLLQNKSSVLAMTHVIWLPRPPAPPPPHSWASARVSSFSPWVPQLTPASKLWHVLFFLHRTVFCRAWLMLTFSGKSLALLVKICTPTPLLVSLLHS